ncbi:MAG: DUF4432 family protein, partial [Ruminococcaceae bacterium]|nr:DUF4432 family protein [Oscillospiraceae bacterium]
MCKYDIIIVSVKFFADFLRQQKTRILKTRCAMNNKYIGNRMQLFDVREYKFSGGKAEGTRAIDIWNGANLHFTILPDRCLDLFTVRYKNKNMAFHTPNGVVNPSYYNE